MVGVPLSRPPGERDAERQRTRGDRESVWRVAADRGDHLAVGRVLGAGRNGVGLQRQREGLRRGGDAPQHDESREQKSAAANCGLPPTRLATIRNVMNAALAGNRPRDTAKLEFYG